jgi:hypothetical protein
VKIGGKPALAILKLEKEEGMQYEPEEKDGIIKYNIKQLQNLMLTGGKLFKIALFIKDNELFTKEENEQEMQEFNSIKGFISDKQSGTDTEVAKFFLEGFLGCYLLDSPEMTTKMFYQTSQKFINLQVEDHERKINYEMALLSVMNSNEQTLSPEDFASLYLHLDDRQKFIDYLSSNEVPTTTFSKNTASIKNNIKSMRLSFGQDLILSLPISNDPDSLGDNIKIEPIDDHKVRIIIEAELGKLGK